MEQETNEPESKSTDTVKVIPTSSVTQTACSTTETLTVTAATASATPTVDWYHITLNFGAP
jgi:hypothetical protein